MRSIYQRRFYGHRRRRIVSKTEREDDATDFKKTDRGATYLIRYCLSVNFTGHKPLTYILYLVKRKHEQQVKLLDELQRVIARACCKFIFII